LKLVSRTVPMPLLVQILARAGPGCAVQSHPGLTAGVFVTGDSTASIGVLDCRARGDDRKTWHKTPSRADAARCGRLSGRTLLAHRAYLHERGAAYPKLSGAPLVRVARRGHTGYIKLIDTKGPSTIASDKLRPCSTALWVPHHL
jgi:hypothetical protein